MHRANGEDVQFFKTAFQNFQTYVQRVKIVALTAVLTFSRCIRLLPWILSFRRHLLAFVVDPVDRLNLPAPAQRARFPRRLPQKL